MNLELKDLRAKIAPALGFIRRYLVFIFFLFFLAMYGFLVFRINTLAASEPDDAAVAEKLETVARPKIDQTAVDKIKKLEAQNIQIQSLFDQARKNPFNE